MATYADAVASVYARSLMDLARQAGGQDKILEIADELEQICELARSEQPFREFLSSPIIDQSRRGKSLRSMFGDRITDLTLRFLLVLNEKGRLGRLESIAAAYDQLVQEAFGRVEVDVYSAVPLDSGQVEAVRNRLSAVLGKEPVLHPYTDSSMLGGLKLRIGDQLIDGSVSTRLRRLKQSLLRSSATAREKLDRFLEGGSA